MGADEHIGYVKPLANAGTDQHKLAPVADHAGRRRQLLLPILTGPRPIQWRQIQGTSVELSDATAEKPVFTPPAEGWYAFELIVGDGQYTSKPDRILVVIGNETPVANAGRDQLWRVPDPDHCSTVRDRAMPIRRTRSPTPGSSSKGRR